MAGALIRSLLLLAVCTLVARAWFAEEYWQERYQLDGFPFEDQPWPGFWSHVTGRPEEGGYWLDNNKYIGSACTGCRCNGTSVSTCTGSVVKVIRKDFGTIKEATFKANTTMIEIYSSQVQRIHSSTFSSCECLEKMIIHNSNVTKMPDISNCDVLTEADFSRNLLSFTTTEHFPAFPDNLTKLNLNSNEMKALPRNFFSGTSIELLSLSNNKFKSIPSDALQNMPKLVYIGLDMNQIELVSKRSCKILAGSQIRFLNLSNNHISYIAQNSLTQLKDLQILELHQNSISKIGHHVFHDMPSLLHLDLNHNKIKIVESQTFTELPSLITLLLHSQKEGFKLITISHTAFIHAGQNLQNLYLGENKLQAVPHGMFNFDNFEKLDTLWIDYNEIANASDISRDDFIGQSDALYETIMKNAKPFKGLHNLQYLHLGYNHIKGISNDTFCELHSLYELYLNDNQMEDHFMESSAFNCLSSLHSLDLQTNIMEAVPGCFKQEEHLQSLNELDFRSNRLFYIKMGAFSSLSSLEYLHLEENSIVTAENNVFPPSIKYISLNSNQYRFTYDGPFQNLSKLEELYMKYMDMYIIPTSAFFGCFRLRKINLFGNDISPLRKDHFRDVESLFFLEMGYCDLIYIEPGTFHQSYYWTIYIYSNKIVRLPVGDFNDMGVSYL